MTYRMRMVKRDRVKWTPAMAVDSDKFEVVCDCGRTVVFDAFQVAQCPCGRLYVAEWVVRVDDRWVTK